MAFLEELRGAIPPEGPHATVDNALDIISDHSALCMARDWLTLMGKDKKIAILFCAHVLSMVGTLNLFLDPKRTYTWRGASLVSSKVQGHGITHARRIREWILAYMLHDKLPLHRLGQTRWTALEDEDIAWEIKLRLTEKAKGRHLKAADVVDVVASPEV
jgi:hypothetical protein